MKCNRFSEEQIIGISKEHVAGVSVSELCRRHRGSDASIYKWKAKYGGMAPDIVAYVAFINATWAIGLGVGYIGLQMLAPSMAVTTLRRGA